MGGGAGLRKGPRVVPVCPWQLGLGSVDNRGRETATQKADDPSLGMVQVTIP